MLDQINKRSCSKIGRKRKRKVLELRGGEEDQKYFNIVFIKFLNALERILKQLY